MFSETEREILIAALKAQEGHPGVGVPHLIFISPRKLYDPTLQSSRILTGAKYKEALASLLARGYISYEGGDLYLLTEKGQESAGELIEKEGGKGQ